MVIDGSAVKTNIKEHYDVIVVGSGAGGAAVAKELAEGGMRVVILEDGHYWRTQDHVDLPNEAVMRMYRDKGFTTTLGIPIIPLPMGRALGGTTLINSGTCFRTPAKVLKAWQDRLGLKDLTEEALSPLFDRVEKIISVEESDYKVMGRANTLFAELLDKRGTPGRPLLRNIRNCEGCGFCCYGCPSGAKQSMEQNYLPRAFLAGAKAYTNCKAVSILVKGKRAIGVRARFQTPQCRFTGHTLEVTADRVILALGTILTPQFLRDNGVAIENKNLGRHLTIHPATEIFAQFEEVINGWEGTPQAYCFDALENEGVVLEGIFLPPDVVTMAVPFVGRRMIEFMKNYKHMAAFGLLISDSGVGRVTRLPLFGTAVLYNLTEEDMRKIQRGVAYVARVFLEGGAKKVYTLIHGHIELSSLEEVDRFEKARIPPEDFEGMAFHPLGTCRMGTSPKTGVVDQNHKVFGWEGLYLCDGSVVPTSLGVNPQETIMAFSTRFAFQVLGNKSIS